MKTVIYKVLPVIVLFLSFSGISFAQEIHIEGTKFIHPIIEKWITEYKKENPDFTIQLKENSSEGESVSRLKIIAHPFPADKQAGESVVYVGRYALLPVSNTRNPLLEIAAKGLKKRDVVNLVFEKNILDDDFDPDEKSKYTATVYIRGSESSTTITLAEYFNQSPERIKGKKIFGDEIYLLNAVQKDETGIAFNTLNYVFNLESRQLKSEISLLPLHLKSKQKEVLESLNIDRILSLLEESDIETIPVENFGLQISDEYINNKDLANFIHWILNNGQKYNHEYGFLNLDAKTFTAQKTWIENNYKDYLSYSKNN
jgi:ABC-type phosphate transport system substrate-binding protein